MEKLLPSGLYEAAVKSVDSTLQNLAIAANTVSVAASPVPPVTSSYTDGSLQSSLAQKIDAIRGQFNRGSVIDAPPAQFISSLFDAIKTSQHETTGLDDRKMALEEVLVFLSRSPRTNFTSAFEQASVGVLYNDLPHPPSTNMGQDWQFRAYDGAGNSREEPKMGASFTPYSRSCSSASTLASSELPDPGLIFDLLEKRDKFVPHPAGLSGLFFSFATSVIHSVFRTNRLDWNINETSSYVDLGILYGNTKAHIDKMRVVDGRGLILPDCFAETRLINLPPAVSAIVILYNRNHNYVAEKLLAINEKGTWTPDVSKLSAADLEKQDYEIFQTARLVNSWTYASTVLGDYLQGIMGTNRDLSNWVLDITSERRNSDHTLLERGRGNSCSVEFNTLYRLHPTLSENDEKWIESQFEALFGTKDWDSLDAETFEIQVAAKFRGKTVEEITKMPIEERNKYKDDSKPTDYFKIPLGGLINRWPRDPVTGRIPDDILAGALQDATSVPAASFRARGVPHVMRVIERLGIEQARNWGCCTMNDFRRFLGLKPYATFEEWNSDPVIADAARKLYRDPEHLELYAGLVAEESKPVQPGAGLCPSFTMSRAILADAIALVRGDRYFTYDLTPFNLTAWGFTEGARDPNNAGNGGTLCRLLARHLPNHYDSESSYTMYPLITPTGQPCSVDKILHHHGKTGTMTVTRPKWVAPTKLVQTPSNFSVLSTGSLVTPYGKNIADLKLNPSVLSTIDDPAAYSKAAASIRSAVAPGPGIRQTAKFFYDRTLLLMREKSLSVPSVSTKDFAVDLVKDVLRIVPVHWAATQVAGLPLKTTAQPHGLVYEAELYDMLRDLYTFVYVDVEKTKKIPLRAAAQEAASRLLRFITLALQEARGGITGSAIHLFSGLIYTSEEKSSATLKRFLSLGKSLEETANDVLATILTASAELGQVFTHVVDYYLAPLEPSKLELTVPEKVAAVEAKWESYNTKKPLHDQISALTASSSPDAIAQLQLAAREALRADPVTRGVYRVAKDAISALSATQGEPLYFDTSVIAQDPKAFNEYSTLTHGDGVFRLLGEDFVYSVAGEVLRAVFTFNPRRAVGPLGGLRRYKEAVVAPLPAISNTEGKYAIKAGEGSSAWRYFYLNSEDGNRLTSWASGLSIRYTDSHAK